MRVILKKVFTLNKQKIMQMVKLFFPIQIIALIITGCLIYCTKPLDGGRCTYDNFPVSIRIVEISKADSFAFDYAQRSVFCHDPFAIKYIFLDYIALQNKLYPQCQTSYPETSIIKIYNNYVYPGSSSISKYKIEIDNIYSGRILKIKSGSCNPCILELDSIDLNDNFEKDTCN